MIDSLPSFTQASSPIPQPCLGARVSRGQSDSGPPLATLIRVAPVPMPSRLSTPALRSPESDPQSHALEVAAEALPHSLGEVMSKVLTEQLGVPAESEVVPSQPDGQEEGAFRADAEGEGESEDSLFALMVMYIFFRHGLTRSRREEQVAAMGLQVASNQAQRRKHISAAQIRIGEAITQAVVSSAMSFAGARQQLKGHSLQRQSNVMQNERTDMRRLGAQGPELSDEVIDGVQAKSTRAVTHGLGISAGTSWGQAAGGSVGIGAAEEDAEATRFELAQRLAEQWMSARDEDVRNDRREIEEIRAAMNAILRQKMEVAQSIAAKV